MAAKIEDVRKLGLFSRLGDPAAAQVAAIARVKKLARQEVLFREGQPVEGMFFVLSGRMKIYKLGRDGKAHILHFIAPGQGFAEAAVFMEGYPAYAEAMEKSEVLCLPKREFLHLLETAPAVSLAMIVAMSQHLKRFADQIEDLSLKDVPARLARWLLAVAEEKKRDFWDLEITKTELAWQLGTVSETLSRTLRKFKEAGWIQVRGRFMKILDRDALTHAAAGGESAQR